MKAILVCLIGAVVGWWLRGWLIVPFAPGYAARNREMSRKAAEFALRGPTWSTSPSRLTVDIRADDNGKPGRVVYLAWMEGRTS